MTSDQLWIMVNVSFEPFLRKNSEIPRCSPFSTPLEVVQPVTTSNSEPSSAMSTLCTYCFVLRSFNSRQVCTGILTLAPGSALMK